MQELCDDHDPNIGICNTPQSDTPVIVGAIRPGMVATDMLLQQDRDRPDRWEEAKRIFNILADQPETVTPWIADRVLANTKNGARIQWLSRGGDDTLENLMLVCPNHHAAIHHAHVLESGGLEDEGGFVSPQ